MTHPLEPPALTTFILVRTGDGIRTTYTSDISGHCSWPQLLDDVILPGLRALGYSVEKEDLDE